MSHEVLDLFLPEIHQRFLYSFENNTTFLPNFLNYYKFQSLRVKFSIFSMHFFCTEHSQSIKLASHQSTYAVPFFFDKVYICYKCIPIAIDIKVSIFQNEFMKSSFLPKYEQKIVKISALTTQGRNPDNFLFVFWEKR